jgi:hypothetical protein
LTIYFWNNFDTGFIAANTQMIPYQDQSKLSSGCQTFAIIRTKQATLSFIRPISVQSYFLIFASTQLK